MILTDFRVLQGSALVTLTFMVALLLGVNNAQSADFVVSKATYSRTDQQCLFELTTTLGPKDDTAEFTLTHTGSSISELRVAHENLLRNLRSTHTAQYSVVENTSSAQKSIVTRVVIKTDNPADVVVSYSRTSEFPPLVSYDLKTTPSSKLGDKRHSLTRYVLLRDESLSNLGWNATLIIEHSKGDLVVDNVNMSSGDSGVLSAPGNFAVSVDVTENHFVAKRNDTQYEVRDSNTNLKNLVGSELIHPGKIRVFSNGKLRFESEVEAALKADASVSLVGPIEPKIAVQHRSESDYWYEAKKIANGQLTFEPATVEILTFKNEFAPSVSVQIGDKGFLIDKETAEAIVPGQRASESTADLLVVTEDRKKRLDGIIIPGRNAAMLASLSSLYQDILNAAKMQSDLGTEKAANEATLTRLIDSGDASASVLNYLRDRIEQLDETIRNASEQEAALRLRLVMRLFPQLGSQSSNLMTQR